MENTLKHLNLTENDFQLIIDGLDALPDKNQEGGMMGDLLLGILSKDDPEMESKMKADRHKRQKEAADKRREMAEEIKILQGKLLMLKRFLVENDALKK